MTKQERMKAFEMRLDGCNWTQIGRALGYASTTVQQDLTGCIMAKPRQVNCVYPAIKRAIVDDYGGSVSAFADACGMSHSHATSTLAGKCPVTIRAAESISKVVGLPISEAFEREEEP